MQELQVDFAANLVGVSEPDGFDTLFHIVDSGDVAIAEKYVEGLFPSLPITVAIAVELIIVRAKITHARGLIAE